MKYLIFTLLCLQSTFAGGKTFEQITDTFPLGTAKQDILKAEPTARVVPSMASPLDSSSTKENVILMDMGKDRRLICQFYLVNEKLAAIMIGRTFLPGPDGIEDTKEIGYISSRKKLSEFSALRAGRELEALEVKVQRYSFGKPGQVALSVDSYMGLELWIVDENIFKSESFFMEPTEENRNKLLKSKAMIDKKLKNATEQAAPSDGDKPSK